MHQVATGSKIFLAVAGMLAAAVVIALVVAAALSRAEQPAEDARAARAAEAAGDAGGGAGEQGARSEQGGRSASPEVERQREPGAGEGRRPARERIDWRDSVAVGLPHDGRLVRGVQLPAAGRTFLTWDPIRKRAPNRDWRRWGTDELVRTVLRVARGFARDNPGAPRIAVGDLSRPRGGDFGPRWGGIGHASHQTGLDVDVYYPLRSGRERAPLKVSEIDMRLAQDLVDRFVAAGAVKVFVGPGTPLTGPQDIVQPLVHHDNHLHARLE